MKKLLEALVPISSGMTSNYQNYIQLQNVLKAEFKINKQWKKKLPKLLINLISVSEGIKPSYLWDIGIKLDVARMNYIISELKLKKLISKNIYIINVGGDTFILNLDAVKEMYNHFNSNYRFIDCSSNLDKPICVDDLNLQHLKKSFDYLIEKVTTFSCSLHEDNMSHLVLEEGIEKGWCYPTLFGILLGYPVVYWSNTLNNCLSDIDLCIYKVSIKGISIPYHWSEIYSFSVPEHLNLPDYINSWFEKLQLKCDFHLKLDQVITCAENIVL